MATYRDIKKQVKKTAGRVPESCWIADAKEQSGVPMRKTWNRKGKRKKPCPDDMLQPIRDAFKHFGMI